MPLPNVIEIERENLPAHPAVWAWSKLQFSGDGPRAIETLKQKPAAHPPERGSSFYQNQRRRARNKFTANLANPVLKTGDMATLEEILATFDFLESRWSRLEEFCRTTPPTFVHGDLKEKNI